MQEVHKLTQGQLFQDDNRLYRKVRNTKGRGGDPDEVLVKLIARFKENEWEFVSGAECVLISRNRLVQPVRITTEKI